MNPMRNDNPFKLGLFSTNAEGGLAFTRVEERWRATWPDIARMARLADDAGLEFILPIARWKGYGGGDRRGGAAVLDAAPRGPPPPPPPRPRPFSALPLPPRRPPFPAPR